MEAKIPISGPSLLSSRTKRRPATIELVSTSAVMDAENITSVLARIKAATDPDSWTPSTMNPGIITTIVAGITSPESTDQEIIDLLTDCASLPTHPIFARGRWFNMSDEQYVRVAPGFVLASHMLIYYETSHFFATYLNSPRMATNQMSTKSEHGTNTPLQRIAYARAIPPVKLPLPFDQSPGVRVALKELSQVVQLNFAIDPLPRSGFTQRTTRAPTAGNLGSGSRITINMASVDRADPLQVCSWSLLTNWMMLATTMVHEVTHAFHFHHSPRLTPEPFFDDQRGNELGWALELVLFGGFLIRIGFTDGSQPLDGTLGDETGCICLDSILDSDAPLWGAKLCALKKSWLKNMFTDSFWAKKRYEKGRLLTADDKVFLLTLPPPAVTDHLDAFRQ